MTPETTATVSRFRWIVIAVCLICLFTSLGASRFWDQDEGFFASTAASMYAQANWIVPSFNGEMFGHKPPWMYWMMMVGYSLFGIGELGARFFSAVFGMATALLAFRMGTRMFNPRVGLLAGIALPTCLMFSVVSRAATPDVFLVFFSTLALYLFSRESFLTRDTTDPVCNQQTSVLPQRWSTWAGMYLVMGFAALVKGPIGFLFPMAVIGLFLLIMTPGASGGDQNSWKAKAATLWRRFGPVNFCLTVWRMRPLTAIAMITIVAGPWYVAVSLATEGAFMAEFFGVHHWQRFTTPMDNHSGPIFYYLLAILIGMFPWSMYGGPALFEWVRQIRTRNQNFTGLVFLGCWVGVYVGLFSLASTKLPNYILPAYPALAIIVAVFIDAAMTRHQNKDIKAAYLSFSGLLITGAVLVAALPIMTWFRFDGQTLLEAANLVDSSRGLFGRLAWIGVPLLAGGMLAIWCARTGHLNRAFQVASVSSMAFIIVFWNDSVPYADQYQTPQQMASRFQTLAQEQDQARLAQLGLFRPSMIFYGGGRVHACQNGKKMLEFLTDENHDSFVITTSEIYDNLSHLHGQIEVVAREPDFPEQGELLLLRQRVQTAHQGSLPRLR